MGDVTFLFITFILIVIFRERIAGWFLRLPGPVFLKFLISSLLFMLIEENVNCLPTGCQLIPPTIPFLLAFVLVLGFIVRSRVRRGKTQMLWLIILFCLFGIFVEYSIGASSAILRTLLNPLGIFMFFWIGLSYAYFVVVPLTVIRRGYECEL